MWYCLAMYPSKRGTVVVSNVSLCSPGLKNVVSSWLSTYRAVPFTVALAVAAGTSMPMRKICRVCLCGGGRQATWMGSEMGPPASQPRAMSISFHVGSGSPPLM